MFTSPTRISANSKTSAVYQLSQHMFHTTPPIELLPSFCIHALHMSYPYLVIASGDRIGVWNVDVNFLFRNAADKSCGQSLAVSCWDGSAFVYATDSAPNDDGGHGNLVSS